MIELVPCPILCEEVFCKHIGAPTLGGLATPGECLQLHNQLLWKPWRPLLEMTHDHCLLQRLRRLVHKCIGPPLLNGETSPPLDHSNSNPPFLCKPGPSMAHRNDKALDSVPSAVAVLSNTSKFGSSATVGTCVSPCVCSLNCLSTLLSLHAPLSMSICFREACDNWTIVLPSKL